MSSSKPPFRGRFEFHRPQIRGFRAPETVLFALGSASELDYVIDYERAR